MVKKPLLLIREGEEVLEKFQENFCKRPKRFPAIATRENFFSCMIIEFMHVTIPVNE